ncbi:hypothetical protein COB64_02000 [Candidatus Wolfebacteria bacterium]|nr:MAG: hypothetical protein COB64_02000 [Candidatus Wolfebacteria bacterium]
MIRAIWTTLFFDPLQNALAFLTSVVPGGDIGIAVILLTVIVKLILAPLSRKSIKSQAQLKILDPEIKKIKEEYKDKEEQARKTFELYKKHKVNPFSGCLLILIQLPIILALYFVFLKGLDFTGGNFYSFISVPETFNVNFLGLIDMQSRSLLLGLLAGVTQFFQIKLSAPKIASNSNQQGSFMDKVTKNMSVQMKYFMPIFVAVIAYQISAAVALYWVTSNSFAIVQEILIRRKMKSTSDKNTLALKEA